MVRGAAVEAVAAGVDGAEDRTGRRARARMRDYRGIGMPGVLLVLAIIVAAGRFWE